MTKHMYLNALQVKEGTANVDLFNYYKGGTSKEYMELYFLEIRNNYI